MHGSAECLIKEVWGKSDKFILNERGILHWNDGSEKILDKKISATTFNIHNALAESEHCSTNDMITKLIKNHKQTT